MEMICKHADPRWPLTACSIVCMAPWHHRPTRPRVKSRSLCHSQVSHIPHSRQTRPEVIPVISIWQSLLNMIDRRCAWWPITRYETSYMLSVWNVIKAQTLKISTMVFCIIKDVRCGSICTSNYNEHNLISSNIKEIKFILYKIRVSIRL